MTWLPWAIVIAAALHVFEECATGFLSWFRRALPALAPGMSIPWAAVVNALFLAWCTVCAAWTSAPGWVRVSPGALVGINALLHAAMAVRLRSWSPGLGTALVLYLPLSALSLANATPRAALGATALALVLHALAPASLWVIVRRGPKI